MRHCKSCNKSVFHAQSTEEAFALGKAGLCVNLEAPSTDLGMFRGLILRRRPTEERNYLKRAIHFEIIDSRPQEVARALKGFSNYFGHINDYSDKLTELEHKGQVTMTEIDYEDFHFWKARLSGWNIEVSRN